MKGHFGILFDIVDKIGSIKCKNGQAKGEVIYEPLEHLSKHFREGQRVIVMNGTETGKSGVILKVEEVAVHVWTDNEDKLEVLKKNLRLDLGDCYNTPNLHDLKKNDLIKTGNGTIGIVLSIINEGFKILNIENSIQTVNNLEFSGRIDTRNFVAKNDCGESINKDSLVVIRKGVNQGRRCRVLHVYLDHLFLFNENFNKTQGLIIEDSTNVTFVTKNVTIKKGNLKNRHRNEE